MQVAQSPASQENGGDMPIERAVCSTVVPGRCAAVCVLPFSVIVISVVAMLQLRPATLGATRAAPAGVNRSM